MFGGRRRGHDHRPVYRDDRRQGQLCQKGSGAIRTIKGFATSGEAKMTKWTTYPVYKAYYNDFNYADTFITNAATHTNANGDDSQFRQQMIKKGAAYMAVWMYVLHEFEDAIADCTTGDVTANDDSVHAW